jgi:hypothetical protein
MRSTRSLAVIASAALAVGLTGAAVRADDDTPAPPKKKIAYSPYPEKNFPNRVYFGDTHVHTSYSTDAGMIGNTLGPDEAYRFARGETVTSSTGQQVRLPRPLDFLVVADHAEAIGLAPAISESSPVVLQDPLGKKLYDLVKAGDPAGAYDAWRAARMSGSVALA